MKAWQVQTEGAFDPVLMALMRAWGVRHGGGRRRPGSGRGPPGLGRRASATRPGRRHRAAGTSRRGHGGGGLPQGLCAGPHAPGGGQPCWAARFRWPAAGLGAARAGLHRGSHGPPAAPAFLHCCARPPSPAAAPPSGAATSSIPARASPARPGAARRWWPRTPSRRMCCPRPSTSWAPTRASPGPSASGVAAAFLLNDGTVRMSPAFRSLHPTLMSRESR